MSDFCGIEAGSVGTNEGTFAPRNFLNVSSWTDGTDSGVNDNTTYDFYGYYPETGTSESTYSESDGGVLLNVASAQTGEFGRHQICSSGKVTMNKGDITKNKMVRFTFAPLTSLIRLRLSISSDSHASFEDAYIKQVTLDAKTSQSNLTGSCFLAFKEGANGTLTSKESAGSRTQINVTFASPVHITRQKEQNGYIDFVLLATGANTGDMHFEVRTLDGQKFTFEVPAPADGFAAGTRYYLDRLVTMDLKPESDDATYVDGGNAWENNIDHDGFYTDAGEAW